MPALALIGGGGFAKEMAEVARLCGFEIEVYYAREKGVLGLDYGGYLDDLLRDRERFDGVALGVGAVNRRSIAARRNLVDWIRANGLSSPPLVSPHALRAPGVTVGDGAFVAHRAILSIDSVLEPFSTVNTSAIVGHDSVVGENVTVAPGAFISGGVTIGRDSMIGPMTTVLQGLSIGSDVMLGVGCTALRSLGDGVSVWPRPDRAA